MEPFLTIVREYLRIESDLNRAFTETDPDRYNLLLTDLRSYYLHPETGTLYAERSGPWTGARAKRYAAYLPPRMTRKISKASRYLSENGAETLLTYLTSLLPADSPVVDFHRCLAWQTGGDREYGIVAEYAWPLGNEKTKKWSFVGGDRNLRLWESDRPSEVIRLIPPTKGPAAVADYQHDK